MTPDRCISSELHSGNGGRAYVELRLRADASPATLHSGQSCGDVNHRTSIRAEQTSAFPGEGPLAVLTIIATASLAYESKFQSRVALGSGQELHDYLLDYIGTANAGDNVWPDASVEDLMDF